MSGILRRYALRWSGVCLWLGAILIAFAAVLWLAGVQSITPQELTRDGLALCIVWLILVLIFSALGAYAEKHEARRKRKRGF